MSGQSQGTVSDAWSGMLGGVCHELDGFGLSKSTVGAVPRGSGPGRGWRVPGEFWGGVALGTSAFLASKEISCHVPSSFLLS